jgi:hypothetical protein
LIFKGLTARRPYKSFGVKGLIWKIKEGAVEKFNPFGSDNNSGCHLTMKAGSKLQELMFSGKLSQEKNNSN